LTSLSPRSFENEVNLGEGLRSIYGELAVVEKEKSMKELVINNESDLICQDRCRVGVSIKSIRAIRM
jgi:hypothetical protein